MASDNPNPRTKKGREELRAKHVPFGSSHCGQCIDSEPYYPCNTITLLDEIDRLRERLKDISCTTCNGHCGVIADQALAEEGD